MNITFSSGGSAYSLPKHPGFSGIKALQNAFLPTPLPPEYTAILPLVLENLPLNTLLLKKPAFKEEYPVLYRIKPGNNEFTVIRSKLSQDKILDMMTITVREGSDGYYLSGTREGFHKGDLNEFQPGKTKAWFDEFLKVFSEGVLLPLPEGTGPDVCQEIVDLLKAEMEFLPVAPPVEQPTPPLTETQTRPVGLLGRLQETYDGLVRRIKIMFGWMIP